MYDPAWRVLLSIRPPDCAAAVSHLNNRRIRVYTSRRHLRLVGVHLTGIKTSLSIFSRVCAVVATRPDSKQMLAYTQTSMRQTTTLSLLPPEMIESTKHISSPASESHTELFIKTKTRQHELFKVMFITCHRACLSSHSLYTLYSNYQSITFVTLKVYGRPNR